MKFIADIGSNHNQSLDRCIQLIKKAKECNCYGIKFQLFKANKLYSKENISTIEILKKRELPEEFIPEIAKVCKEENIEFGCTPFDLEAVDILKNYVDFLKIGSYELLYLPLIQKVAKTNKPLMISTGMATISEIVDAITACQIEKVKDLTIFHCVSNYPTYPWECDLDRIKELKDYFPKATIGWSDHTTVIPVILKAKVYGAEIIEFHFDLEDQKGYESAYGHCWTPENVSKMITSDIVWDMIGISSQVNENSRLQRMDPTDGHRPILSIRSKICE